MRKSLLKTQQPEPRASQTTSQQAPEEAAVEVSAARDALPQSTGGSTATPTLDALDSQPSGQASAAGPSTSPGVDALAGDGSGARVPASTRTLHSNLIMGPPQADQEEAHGDEAPAPDQGVGGGPIDYVPTDDPSSDPPDPLPLPGSTQLARDTEQLGPTLAGHLDQAAGRPASGTLSTSDVSANGEVHTASTLSPKTLTGGPNGVTGEPARGREVEEREPEVYAGDAPYDRNVDASDIDEEGTPPPPPFPGDWSYLPGPGDPGYSDWQQIYQSWWYDHMEFNGDFGGGGGSNTLQMGELPTPNMLSFHMLHFEYVAWWEQTVASEESSAEDLASIDLALGGISGTDEDMAFDADHVNVDEYLQQGADPARLDGAVAEGHGEVDRLLAQASQDAAAMRTESLGEAELAAQSVEVDFDGLLAEPAQVESPERPDEMEAYLALIDSGSIEAEVADGFDVRTAPGVEAHWTGLQGEVDTATADFEGQRHDAMDDGVCEASVEAEATQAAQLEALESGNADIDAKRADVEARQAQAVDEAKREMDARKQTELDKIQSERSRVQGDVDGQLADAEKQVDDEIEKGKKEAEKKRKEGEEKKKKRKWWQALWDFVSKIVKWVVDQVKKVFDAVRSVVNFIVKTVVDAVTALIDTLRELVVAIVEALATVLTELIQATLGQVFPALADELCGFIDTVADFVVETVNTLADQLIESIEKVAKVVLDTINTLLAVVEFVYTAALQATLAAISGDWGEFLLFVIESALEIAGISKEEFQSYFGEDPEVLQTVVDDPAGFMDRFGEAFGQGFGQFGDNFGTHLKTGFFEWLTGALGDFDIVIPDKWDLKGIIQFVLSVLGVTPGSMRAKVKEFFGEKTARIVDMLIDYGMAFREDGLRGVVREVALDVTGTVREDVIDKAAADVEAGSGGSLLDSLLGLLDAFATGDGLQALFDFAMDDLGGIIRDLLIDSIIDIVMEKVITQAILQLASMFNPVSALVQMLVTAWRVIQSIRDVMARIQAVILTIVEGLVNIVIGNIAPVADMIEGALADLIPVAIELLMGVLGLGNLNDQIVEALDKLRATVDEMIDNFFKFIREKVDQLIATVSGWFDDNPDEADGEGGAAMDPMTLAAGGGPVVYWVEDDEGNLVRVVQGDPEGLAESWGGRVEGHIEGLGGSEGATYAAGGAGTYPTGSLEGQGDVDASEAPNGEVAFTPGAMQSAATTPAAWLSDFAAAAPSVQAQTWPDVGGELGGLAAENVDGTQQGMAPIEAHLDGEATGGEADVDLQVHGEAPAIDVAAPTVDDVPLPTLVDPGGEDLTALAAAMPDAPGLEDAPAIDRTALERAHTQGAEAAHRAGQRLTEDIDTVAADEAIVPIAADVVSDVPELDAITVADTPALSGMSLYAELALPQDVHAAFDAQMMAASADTLAPAEQQLSGAEGVRDEGVQLAVQDIDTQAQDLVSQAGVDQATVMTEQRARVAGARAAAQQQQAEHLAELDGVLEGERQDRMSEIDYRLASDQGRLDAAYADARSEADTALGDAERKAEAAQAETEDPSWWDRLADYAQQAVDWLRETIADIFASLRRVVADIFDAVTQVAGAIIAEATAFVTDALTGFGEFVQAAIQEVLGEALPELAAALCALVEDAVHTANSTLIELATQLEQDIADLARGLEDTVNAAFTAYESAIDSALSLAQTALEGDWDEILRAVVEAVLGLAGIEPAAFWELVDDTDDVLRAIIDDPGSFVSNAIEAMNQGFSQFGDNFPAHLEAGFLEWVGGELGDIELPQSFDLAGVFDLTLQVLGLDADGLREKAEDRLGAETVEVLDQVWGFVDAAIAGGLDGLWEHVQGELGSLWDSVVGGIQDWLVEKVVVASITKLASLFTPVGALVQAIKTVWEVYEFLQEQADQLYDLVRGWVDSLTDIVNGSLDGAAASIEGVLAGAIPLAIDLLARLIGVGDLGENVRAIIDSVQGMVDDAIDALFERLADLFRSEETGDGDGETESPDLGPVTLPDVVHFEDAAEEDHRLWFEPGDPVHMWVASEPPEEIESAVTDGHLKEQVEGSEASSVISRSRLAEQHIESAKDAQTETERSQKLMDGRAEQLAIVTLLEGTGDGFDPTRDDYKKVGFYADFIQGCADLGYADGDALFRTLLQGMGYSELAGTAAPSEQAEAALNEQLAEARYDVVSAELMDAWFDGVATEGRTYALWSGSDYAKAFAAQSGHTTLEMTLAGQFFDDLGVVKDGTLFDINKVIEIGPLWTCLSRAFAERIDLSRSPVHVYQRWIGGVYEDTEIQRLRDRASDLGMLDELDLRFHALVLVWAETAAEAQGEDTRTPVTSTISLTDNIHCIDLSGSSGDRTRSDWLSRVTAHEQAAGGEASLDVTDLLAAVEGLSDSQAEQVVGALDGSARRVAWSAIESAFGEGERALVRRLVRFLASRAIEVAGVPPELLEDAPEAAEAYEPEIEYALTDHNLEEMAHHSASDQDVLSWASDWGDVYTAEPDDRTADAVQDSAGSHHEVHKDLEDMSREEVLQSLQAIHGSAQPLAAEVIASLKVLNDELLARFEGGVFDLDHELEQALLSVFSDHLDQHMAANPLLREAWEQTVSYYQDKRPELFDGDLVREDISQEDRQTLWSYARQMMNRRFESLVAELEATHGAFPAELRKLPKGIEFHHIVQQSVVPAHMLSPTNLILANRDGDDDLHSLMHLLTAGTGGVHYAEIHEHVRPLLSRVFGQV